MSSSESVALLEIEPDLADYLTPEERRAAERLTVPVQSAFSGTLDIDAVLAAAGAFGLLLLEGMLLHEMSMGDKPALRVLGPGDMVTRSGAPPTSLLTVSSYRVAHPISYAVLGDRVLAAAHRYPRLVAGLQIRTGDQHHRLAAQLLICQLPRVEDRVLALMWLLADSWGRVTRDGTQLPLRITHETIGALVGARRPTVTLALKQLTADGAILRQSDGWLLISRPTLDRNDAPAPLPDPELVDARLASPWQAPPGTQVPNAATMLDVVEELRMRTLLDVEQNRRRRERSARARAVSRRLIAESHRRRSGSSGDHHHDDSLDGGAGAAPQR